MYFEFIHLKKVLSNFKNCESIFAQAFEHNQELGFPIRTVLELGVYRLPSNSEPFEYFPGQSTKTLFILHKYFNFEKMVSLDIDDCHGTIQDCKEWCQKLGVPIPPHKFIQSNSIHYNVAVDFPNGVDLIFLDTNHDDDYPEKLGYPSSGGAGMTYQEICHFAPQISRNGQLFLHDTKKFFVEKRYGWNTIGAVERFICENSDFIFIEHNANENGLGQIIRKDSDIATFYLEN